MADYPKKARYRDALPHVHHRLGTLLVPDRPRKAEEAYQQAARLWEKRAATR